MSDLPKFPLARGCPMSPPVDYPRFREVAPATPVQVWDGSTAWLVTRHKDVRALLSDESFSATPTRPGFPKLSATKDAQYAHEPPTFFRMDPPEHGPRRAMVAQEFAMKAVVALRPQIQATVDTLIDAMLAAGPTADFIRDFANPLPSLVISRLLGVPYEDHDYFEQRSIARLDTQSDAATVLAASRDMLAYLDRLITRREEELKAGAVAPEGADLLTRLVHEQVLPGHLSHDDAVAVAELLLRGGHETTSSQMTMGLLTLFQHPEQWQALQADHGLVRPAIEEMLRFNTIVQFVGARVCVRDTEIGGHAFKAGDGVYALISAANRDPAVFTNPDSFDIRRRPNPHLAFGAGPHVCVGQMLARAEMELAFSALLARLPGLHLATPFEEIEFKSDFFIYGPDRLSVAWSVARSAGAAAA